MATALARRGASSEATERPSLRLIKSAIQSFNNTNFRISEQIQQHTEALANRQLILDQLFDNTGYRCPKLQGELTAHIAKLEAARGIIDLYKKWVQDRHQFRSFESLDRKDLFFIRLSGDVQNTFRTNVLDHLIAVIVNFESTFELRFNTGHDEARDAEFCTTEKSDPINTEEAQAIAKQALEEAQALRKQAQAARKELVNCVHFIRDSHSNKHERFLEIQAHEAGVIIRRAEMGAKLLTKLANAVKEAVFTHNVGDHGDEFKLAAALEALEQGGSFNVSDTVYSGTDPLKHITSSLRRAIKGHEDVSLVDPNPTTWAEDMARTR